MEFIDNSEAVKRELERAAIRGLIKASLLVEGQAVLLAPVDKGGLRDSIGYKVDESELVAYIGTNCEYAIYVEYGKKPVPYKNWAKSVNIFYVYIILDNWRKMAYNLIKEMIICNEMLKVDLLRGVTRIILV
jgi:hypothetical protein